MEKIIVIQPLRFIPIHIDTIKPEMRLIFDLHIKSTSQGKTSYPILKREGEKLETSEKERLLQQGIHLLFIKESQLERYEEYLNRMMSEGDPKSVSALLYQKSSLLIRELFEEQLSRFSFLKALWKVDELIKSMTESERVTSHLFWMMSYDYHTYTHCVNVCILSLGMAIRLGFGDSLRDIGMGSLLHDIGKRMIPREVLEKPGPLSDEEWEQMKKHPLYSFEMLRGEGGVSRIACEIALQHHEKMDGSGYPRGLRGVMIHRFSRLVCIADIFDALTSSRPYKGAVPPFDALRVMVEEMRGKLDVELLREFILFVGGMRGIKGYGRYPS